MTKYLSGRSLITDVLSGRRRKGRRGFTIVELLAATALAALVLAALAGLLRNLALQDRVLFDRRAPEPWRQSLLQQIRWDLANARQIALLPDELHLIGCGSRDFGSGLPTQRPTEVIYFVAGSAQRNWLMRQEIHPDEFTNRNHRLELVVAHVDHLVVDRLDRNGREQPIPKTAGPVPRRLRLRLIASGRSVPIVDETLYIRWEP